MSENTYQLTIRLSQKEKDALAILAERQGRTPGKQVVFMLREDLVEYGLMKWSPTPDQMTLKVFETGEGL